MAADWTGAVEPAVLGLSAPVLTYSVTVFLIKGFAHGPYVE